MHGDYKTDTALDYFYYHCLHTTRLHGRFRPPADPQVLLLYFLACCGAFKFRLFILHRMGIRSFRNYLVIPYRYQDL